MTQATFRKIQGAGDAEGEGDEGGCGEYGGAAGLME